MYFVYEKSPKKCRKLQEVVEQLRECLDETEMPTKGGTRPLRACGTRFITDKVTAVARLVDLFGAYVSHLTILSEEPGVRAADRQKLKSYKSNVLQGCTVYHDLLKPAANLCKVLQEKVLCVVQAIEAMMKMKEAVDKFKHTAVEDLPTMKKVLMRIKREEKWVTYQNVDLKPFEQGLEYVQAHKV